MAGHPTLSADELARAARQAVHLDRGPLPGLDEPSRLLATPVRIRGEPLVLVVGATLGDRADALASLRTEMLVGGPIALLLLCLVVYATSGAALRPIEAMRQRAAAITGSRPGERLPVPPVDDEVSRLGETLNEMLHRLEEALARERRLVADAGHELRTPLALLKVELELALRHGGTAEELEDSLRSAAEESDRLAQLAENLLILAQAGDRSRDESLVVADLGRLCATVVQRFSRLAEDAGRTIALEAPDGLAVRGDALNLEQALVNLLDNALRHGGGRVTVSVSAAGDRIDLHVTDEGPGFPAPFLARAFERFSRADEARGRGGAGLGLSIVQVVAEAAGGTAHVANRPEGGADAWVSLARWIGPAPEALSRPEGAPAK